MPTVTVQLDERGKLSGVSDKDAKGWAKFIARVKSLGNSCLTFSWREPRSGPYHRRFFKMIHTLFASQDVFENEDRMREYLEMGAGHVDWIHTPFGDGLYPRVKSIDYATLDQAEFEPIATAIWAFARSPRCLSFLWPHLSEQKAAEMIEAVLGEFER